MCGIAGFFGNGDADVLRRMTDRVRHRGPDDEGFLADPLQGAFLGQRRLSVVDIAGGHQPMSTADDAYTIVFNGEIYNFRELRRELTELGARFVSDHSDTEVLLHGYRQWGERLPHHLNGMWAFAILDRVRHRVFFSRDRFGKKPLFWSLRGDTLVFASELTSMREHPSVRGELSERALRKYFAHGFVPAPLTFFVDVNKLPAGHSLTFDLGARTARIERWWQYQPEPFETRPVDAETRWTEEFSALLDKAVARRLVADVPVGCFLSGGLDSSTVAALAIHHTGRDRLKTFSIGFEEASFDETGYARQVAAHIGADHQIETLSIQRALDILPDIAARWDEPIADSSMLPTYLLCQHARRHVTVALGGDGADELLAGYDPFRALRYARAYEKWVPKPVHRAISLLAARLPVSHRYMSFDFRAKRTLRGLDHPPHLWLPVWMSPLAPSELDQLFNAPADLDDVYSEAIDAWDSCASTDIIERTIAYYIRLYLQDDILVKVDRASMLHSLEVRAPFLDIDLVDFLRRLPADMKLRGSTSKYILRQAARPLLPSEVLTRGKQGFGVPIGRWLHEGRLQVDPMLGINPVFWRRLNEEHGRGQYDHRLALQTLLAIAPLGAAKFAGSP
ncbi:asparagine synthase (glutamine-hydrolyzing) [Dokdonella soli]|uniref:asparagine synthase (glutamine-hydrolyzing) n=1 Tax=Dokdonella soli TaxID=529810 RepID=A0ABP3TT28_9GAMM